MRKRRKRVHAYGEQLRALRKGAGLSIAELAERIKTNRTSVTRWELGERSLTLEDAARYVAACGADLSALATED